MGIIQSVYPHGRWVWVSTHNHSVLLGLGRCGYLRGRWVWVSIHFEIPPGSYLSGINTRYLPFFGYFGPYTALVRLWGTPVNQLSYYYHEQTPVNQLYYYYHKQMDAKNITYQLCRKCDKNHILAGTEVSQS